MICQNMWNVYGSINYPLMVLPWVLVVLPWALVVLPALQVKKPMSGQEENMWPEVQKWQLSVVPELPVLAEERYCHNE